ncbi:MAG: Calx-beta domain-containing protein, partial [Cyanobacteriota bacterium]|nr:Calx-beta domain-containing protein [Cyanobacteriota bacterium]
MANPSAKEQYMLELINRMRINPEAEYDLLVNSGDEDIESALGFFNVDLNVLQSQWDILQPAQPVAWSNQLHDSAEVHSQLMIDFDEQSHNLPGEPSLGDRVFNAGYQFQTVAENIFAFGRSVFESHAAFAIDWGNDANGIQNPPGHRDAIMSNRYREVGISILPEDVRATSVGPLVVTQHFGNSQQLATSDTSWLLGTAFRDVDNDDFYSVGEGLSNITVEISSISDPIFSTTIQTQDAGGYQTLLSPGEYQIEFIRGDKTVKTEEVTIDDENVKLDLMIDGKTYQLDGGTRDAHYNPGGGDAIVFNAYTVDSQYQTIDFISIGLSNLGNPSAVFLYQDKDNDKQPDSDEKILEVDTKDLDLDKEGFAHIAINPTKVENTFFVAALYESQNNEPTWIPVDNDSSANQSWIAATDSNNLDLDSISTSLLEDKNFLLRASSSDSAALSEIVTPSLPTVNIQAIDDTADESGDTATFSISRSGDTSTELTVNYNISGSAESGKDYQNLSGNVNIAAGETSVNISIIPVDDAEVETSESIILSLNSNVDYQIGNNDTATASITDNDIETTPVEPPTEDNTSQEDKSETIGIDLQTSNNIELIDL